MEEKDVEERKAHEAIVSFGSNLTDRRDNIKRALRYLSLDPCIEIIKTSSLWETPPAGGPCGQQQFLNGALIVRTTISALELLKLLNEIESRLYRKRERFWDARTIDLDLIWFDGDVICEPGLIVPHPRLYWRHFVLDPVCEIAPNAIVPTTRMTFWEHRILLYRNFCDFPTLTALLQAKTCAVGGVYRSNSKGFI